MPTRPGEVGSGDREVRFLASAKAAQPLRISSRAGQVMPAHFASAVKALLAELSADELAALRLRVRSDRPLLLAPHTGACRRPARCR